MNKVTFVITSRQELMTVDGDDDLSIYKDARDEMIHLHDELPEDDIDDSTDQCVYHANLHHLIHKMDATIVDHELISHGPKKTSPSTHNYNAL